MIYGGRTGNNQESYPMDLIFARTVCSLLKSLTICILALLTIAPAVFGQEAYYEPIIRPLGSKYRVHKTRHFEIIFEEGSEVEAWQTALTLERKLPEAQSISGLAGKMWMPVILNNSSDRSNGYVHTHPFRQEIEIPHIKGNRLGTRSNSWIETVVTHELVHAAQAQAGGPWGLGKALYWLAPDAARALNLSLPPGLNEGAAVYLESEGAHAPGRLHDRRFQMHYRAAAASGHPWSLSQLLESSRYGFHASRHYIGGAHFFAWQSSKDEGLFFEKMRTKRYRNPVGSTGMSLRNATGQPLRTLLAVFRQETDPGFRRGPRQPAPIVESPGVMQRRPQWLNDSTLVVYREGLNVTPGLYRLDIHSGAAKRIHPVRLPEDAWFSVADSVILYSRYVPDRFSTLAWSADIFKYDMSQKRESRLTYGARVHAPVQTPSGIWALQNDGQRNNWIEIDAAGRIQTIRDRSQADLIQIAPSEEVTAVLVRHSQHQGIYRADSNGVFVPWIFQSDNAIRELSWSSDGRYLLFTADSGPATNVFYYDLELERAYQLTDVLYGALDPVLSEDNRTLVYIDYQHERYNVVATEFSPEDGIEIPLMPISELPEISPRLELPEEFSHGPYRMGRRLRPRMFLPVAVWSSDTPERRLGLGGGLGIHGSDPLRRLTYMTEATLQSQKLWGRIGVSSALGRVIGRIDIYNRPDAVVARVITEERGTRYTREVTYGERSMGIGLTFVLPLRFEANVRHTYASILAGVSSERTRWFSLDDNQVPYRRGTGQSLAEWDRSTRLDTGILVALGLQQNTRDVRPNRGTVFGIYGRADVIREHDSRQTGLYMSVRQYWSIFQRWNTNMRVGASILSQSGAGVYSRSLVLPQGHEVFLGKGTHVRLDAEILQPIWYMQDGFLTVPSYFKVLYVYGFAQKVVVSSDYQGNWSSGLGMGLQFRLLHYLDMEVRASFNPLDFNKGYFTLM